MSTLTASARPTLAKLKKDIESYSLVIRSHLLAIGDCWEDVHPMRSGSSVERFRYYLDRFSKLLQHKPSKERELALVVVRNRLWKIACYIEDGRD